jgi:thymidine kinase
MKGVPGKEFAKLLEKKSWELKRVIAIMFSGKSLNMLKMTNSINILVMINNSVSY